MGTFWGAFDVWLGHGLLATQLHLWLQAADVLSARDAWLTRLSAGFTFCGLLVFLGLYPDSIDPVQGDLLVATIVATGIYLPRECSADQARPLPQETRHPRGHAR